MRILNMLRASAVALAFGLVPSLALAQSNPGWSYGTVPTPAQWAAAFSSKQDVLNFVPLNVAGGVMSGRLVTAPPSAAVAGFNLTCGSVPASPVNGDQWCTTSGMFVQINGATIGPLAGANSTSFGATLPVTVSFPSGVATYACPTCGVTGSPLSQFAATTSAQLRGVLSDESGTGAALFQNGALGTPTATSLALGGATIGGNALAVTGTFAFSAGGSFGGALTGISTLAMSGQLSSTLATGTAPFVVASTTNVANLNASSLSGATFSAPGAIGGGTAGSGAFTTLSASGLFSLNNGGSLGGTISGTPTLSGANFITRANIQTLAASSLAGNPTGAAATESAVTLGSTLNFSGTTLNCTAMSASQVGCGQPDGSTITIVGGKMVASGGSATTVTIASTTIGGGTAGGVLTNTAGVLSNSSAGTLGQALVSSGGTTPPTFQSGTWVLLNTLTAAGSASLFDTTHITSSYNEYLLVFENVLPATGAVTCEIQLHSGGSFQATNYQNSTIGGNSSSPFSQANTTYIGCSPNGSTANSGMGVSGTALLFNPSSSALKSITGEFVLSSSVAGTVTALFTGGMWNSSAVVDGFQVLMSSGNITSGTVKLYGRL